MSGTRILVGDCRELLRTLPDASVQMACTSPPYWNLRNYGVDGQIGLETGPDEYVSILVDVFSEVRRVLHPTGVLFLNLGDCYAGSGKGPTGHNGIQQAEKRQGGVLGYRRNKTDAPAGYNADAVREKYSPMTTDTGQRKRMIAEGKFSTEDEFAGRATGERGGVGERMFRLNENGRNMWNYWPLPASDPPTAEQRWLQLWSFAEDYFGDEAMSELLDAFQENQEGAPPSDYWLLSPEMFKDAHFAVFPTEIPRRAILAGSRPGDTVLDPFSGAGTTGLVASRLGRDYIGIELSPVYADMSVARLAGDCPLFEDIEVGA